MCLRAAYRAGEVVSLSLFKPYVRISRIRLSRELIGRSIRRWPCGYQLGHRTQLRSSVRSFASRRCFHQSVLLPSESACFTLGPLGSRLFQAFHRYYEPLRLPLLAASALLSSAMALQLYPSPGWVSQVPDCSFQYALPGFTPESPKAGFSHLSIPRCWLLTF